MNETRGAVIFSAVFIVCVAALGRFLAMDAGERHWEVFTEMVYSRAQESNTPSSELPGGLTQQALVEGVVPRGLLPLRFDPGPEGAIQAGEILSAPDFQDEAAANERGRELYGIYCAPCHGLGGDGRGPVVMRGMIPPPSLKASRARELKDGSLFHVLTYGQGNMASYASQLTREERWLVVRHLRNLQGAQ